ncbi:MAG: class I SAM-dependent RNA methyltransferase [Myxococcota bacterium]
MPRNQPRGQPGPRKPSNEVVVTPEGWLSRGEAFVRGEGKQLAVYGGIPGEAVRVRVLDRTGPVHRARAIAPVGKPHPDRVVPACERWNLCGHCPLMHLSAEGQRRAQHALISHAFEGFAVDPVVAGEHVDVLHAVDLVAGWSDERRPRLGIVGREGKVVPIPECPVVHPDLRALMNVAAHHMIELELHPWDGHRGSVRALHARRTRAGEVVVTLIMGRAGHFTGQWAQAIAGGLAAVVGVAAHFNDAPGWDHVVRDESGAIPASPLTGRVFVEDTIAGLRIRIGPLDPFPAVPAMAERAVEALVEMLAPAAGDAVLDVGTGLGIRALALARAGGWALGVDEREDLVRRARESAALSGVTAEFATGELPVARLAGLRPLVVADVGRKGLGGDVLDAIAGLAPRRVALVGQNPMALAQDARSLTKRGLRLRRVAPFDVAPHTMFVESVALLASEDDSPPARRAPRRKTLR